MRARSIATFFAFALTTALGSSVAYAQSDLAEAETSYKGAVMLDGGVDAKFDYAWEGLFNSWEFDQTEYATLLHFGKSLEETLEMLAITLLWTAILSHSMRVGRDVRVRFIGA